VAFSSGMAAITAVLATTLKPGGKENVVVMPSDGYYGARALADGYFAPQGIVVRKGRTAGNSQAELLDCATLLWLESPSNPGLDVCDISELVRLAHARGALVAVDNTTATVLGQRPLSFGADFSVSSDSKGLTGHEDLMLGHVAAREQAWADKLLAFRTQQGAVPGPMEVWLAHRSLATLEVRLERQSKTALEVARLLAKRTGVSSVRYPGLPRDPSYALASKQMAHYGPVVGFVLKDKEQAEGFLDACKVIVSATSFGGVHSTAERRARWGGDAVAPGFIRFSAGCEDTLDILQDISQALDAVSR